MQPRRVLAVDDSKLMLKMYEIMLREYPVVFAEDGEEALRRLDEHGDIDVVLLDLNMPKMGGLEVLARMSEAGRLSGTKVIVVTTEGSEDDVTRGLAAGAAAYITKPFNSTQILEVIAGT